MKNQRAERFTAIDGGLTVERSNASYVELLHSLGHTRPVDENPGDPAAELSTAMDHENLLTKFQPEMLRFRQRTSRYLTGVDRIHEWTTYEDEGVIALRLRVLLALAGLDTPIESLTYWIRESDSGVEMMVDENDGKTPTAFGRRNVRAFAAGDLGFKQAEHLIAAQVTFTG